jgi:hypothetical protein
LGLLSLKCGASVNAPLCGDLQRGYFTMTQSGCRIGYATDPITAVIAINNGLLTFQRDSTASDAAPIRAVSQSPMAMRPSRMQAPRMVPMAAA